MSKLHSKSIYVHIPFCASKCGYCSFYSVVADEETRNRYVDSLLNQINKVEPLKRNYYIESVFFGGGTPSLLSKQELHRILEALDKKFDIRDAEISIEINPDSVANIVSENTVPDFNRFSMGVQSFNDSELRFLGRRHTAIQAVEAFELLRRFGAKNINLDFITGLPIAEHSKNLERTLQTASFLSPEHISVYLLSIEQNTPFSLLDFNVDEDSAADNYLYASEFLESEGYEHYEISNFAKPSYRCAHNMGYWRCRPYYAFGPAAAGFDGTTRFKYKEDLNEYLAKNGAVRPITEEVLDEKAKLREKFLLSLRLRDGITEKLYTRLRSKEANVEFIEKLLSEGLAVETDEKGFALTPKGWLVSNEIMRELQT